MGFLVAEECTKRGAAILAEKDPALFLRAGAIIFQATPSEVLSEMARLSETPAAEMTTEQMERAGQLTEAPVQSLLSLEDSEKEVISAYLSRTMILGIQAVEEELVRDDFQR